MSPERRAEIEAAVKLGEFLEGCVNTSLYVMLRELLAEVDRLTEELFRQTGDGLGPSDADKIISQLHRELAEANAECKGLAADLKASEERDPW